MDTTCLHTSEGIPVHITTGLSCIEGNLKVPTKAIGVVLFAHGSGSSRHSQRNRYVAHVLNEHKIATLLIDLLTLEEEHRDALTGELRFDSEFLAKRVLEATEWLCWHPLTRSMPIGYFGASTGAGAALLAAAEKPEHLQAIVSRGGRPDLAGNALQQVDVPTLLIVGGNDLPVITFNRNALELLHSEEKYLEIVPGATHLFEEPGTLEAVAQLASDWFARHFTPQYAVHTVN